MLKVICIIQTPETEFSLYGVGLTYSDSLHCGNVLKKNNLPVFMRDKLGGVPYETRKDDENVTIRFYPKGENAKNPDGIVFMLSLNGNDRKKMSEIIS